VRRFARELGIRIPAVQSLRRCDWENPESNDFALAEELTLKGGHERRPDIVLYVNGIALVVLELKHSSVEVAEGVRQLITNQEPIFNEAFFSTVQLVLAGSDSEGFKTAQERICTQEGGVIWHTQGSGKSILMVMLTKWLLEHDPNGRVLVVTDRDELDKQIEGVMRNAGVIATDAGSPRITSRKEFEEKLTDTKPVANSTTYHFQRRIGKNECEVDFPQSAINQR